MLLEAESVFKGLTDDSASRPSARGRPPSTSIFEVLAQNDATIISEATLREATHVAMTMAKFPLLAYVNEPISHFSNTTVRSSVQLLADELNESMVVPESIMRAYRNTSPYVLDVFDLTPESLSLPIPLKKIVPNDGDGLVELQSTENLQDSQFHRLHGIDAPELYATSFININNKVIKRRHGHLSHLALHFYLNSLVEPRGTGYLFRERARNGETPVDIYNRQISSFWVVWCSCPNVQELSMIDDILEQLENAEEPVKRRICSMINPRYATNDRPFFLSLNALLVLSGFSYVFTK